jgi:RimJ/RimL family protein N-acetyltransferase
MDNSKTIIETERLQLRRFRADDWADLHAYLSDPEVVRYEPYGVFTAAQCRQEARRRANDGDFWAVTLSETGKMIGNLYLSRQKFDTWELGFVFNRDYQGCGCATESAAALINYAFTNLETRKVIAMCSTENGNSWRLLERLGLRREGCLRRNVYFKTDERGDPIWFDTYVYGLLRSDGTRQTEAECRESETISMKNNVVLIGMPGAGKSTVGVVLAKTLGYDFIDTDILLSRRIGTTLQRYIDRFGIDEFLKEEELAALSLDVEQTIIATGGSMPLSERAMRH